MGHKLSFSRKLLLRAVLVLFSSVEAFVRNSNWNLLGSMKYLKKSKWFLLFNIELVGFEHCRIAISCPFAFEEDMNQLEKHFYFLFTKSHMV